MVMVLPQVTWAKAGVGGRVPKAVIVIIKGPVLEQEVAGATFEIKAIIAILQGHILLVAVVRRAADGDEAVTPIVGGGVAAQGEP